MTTLVQQRVLKVLDNMRAMAAASDDDARMLADILEDGLSELRDNDCFGTEGQCDPRGDQRDGDWSMDNVQGIDG